MSKFDVVYESFVDAVNTKSFGEKSYVEIFKNPTSDDLRQCGRECRGIITKDGDLYIAPTFNLEGRVILHRQIFNALKHLKLIKFDDIGKMWRFDTNDVEGIGVQRSENSNEFWLGESIKLPSDDHRKQQVNRQIDKILQKASNQNPHLKFINKRINTKYLN